MQMLYGNKNLTSTNNREGVTQSSLYLQITVNAQKKKIKINLRYLPAAVFIALMLVQIPETNNLNQT